MHLRRLIRGNRPINLEPQSRQSVATIAVATAAEGWPDRLQTLPAAPGVQWGIAADALHSILLAGVVTKALALGWDAREIIGVCRSLPHDSPSRAGLIWSVKPGDIVADVRRAGCIIAYGNVRHIWKRAPIAADIVLPWELTP